MCRICARCGSIAEYRPYYGIVICTKCGWKSEKIDGNSDKYTTKLDEKNCKVKELDIKVASLSNV